MITPSMDILNFLFSWAGVWRKTALAKSIRFCISSALYLRFWERRSHLNPRLRNSLRIFDASSRMPFFLRSSSCNVVDVQMQIFLNANNRSFKNRRTWGVTFQGLRPQFLYLYFLGPWRALLNDACTLRTFCREGWSLFRLRTRSLMLLQERPSMSRSLTTRFWLYRAFITNHI